MTFDKRSLFRYLGIAAINLCSIFSTAYAQDELDFNNLLNGPRIRVGGNTEGASRVTLPRGTVMPDGTVLTRDLTAVLTIRRGAEFAPVVENIRNLSKEGIFARVLAADPPTGGILMEDMTMSRSGLKPIAAGTVRDIGDLKWARLNVHDRQVVRAEALARLAEHPDGHLMNVMYRAVAARGGVRVDVKMVDPFPQMHTSWDIANLFTIKQQGAGAQYHPEWQSRYISRELGLQDEPSALAMYNIGRGYIQEVECTPSTSGANTTNAASGARGQRLSRISSIAGRAMVGQGPGLALTAGNFASAAYPYSETQLENLSVVGDMQEEGARLMRYNPNRSYGQAALDYIMGYMMLAGPAMQFP